MRRLKSLIGILLILLSLGSLFFWEWKGREAITMEQVLVAGEEIRKGQRVSAGMFVTIGVPRENLMESALTPGQIDQLRGKVASQMILKNNQISMEFFEEENLSLRPKESLFVIKPEWIAMRSSSLRRGDSVDIYGEDGRGLIGTFRVAFVKDETEREVRDIGKDNLVLDKGELLERTNSSSEIDHIEVITTMDQYQMLLSCTGGEFPTRLIIVQRGEKFDS